MSTSFRNLDPLLNPGSIAVVGASTNPLKIGGRPIAYMKSLGFAGEIFPVNAKNEVVQGLPAYPSLSAIGKPVDLAIMAAPAASIEALVDEGLAIGVKVFVVFSSGFAEFSAGGAEIQARLSAKCREAGALLLGPNCLGAINVASRMVASFTTAMENASLIEGGFGFVSQSGALGAYWLDMVLQKGLGVSAWIATGNEADVTVSDAIHHLANDPHTKVIGVYVEDIKDGAAFRMAALSAIAAGKPILLIKAGRSAAGAAAAASHTGALAGEDSRYQALFDQIGIVRVRSLTEMIATADLILKQPAPAGSNVGIISVSGGAGVMLADELEEAGFDAPAFGNETVARLTEALPGFVSARNPLDVTGSVAGDPGIFANVLKAVSGSQEHDAYILFIGLMASISRDLSQSLREVFAGMDKQVVIVWIGAPAAVIHDLEDAGFPVFGDIPEAVAAMARVRDAHRAGARARDLAARRWPAPLPPAKALTPLSEVNGQALLRDVTELAFPRHELVTDADGVAGLRGRLAAPFAVKLQSPDMLHKSEHGGVKLGLTGEAELRECVDGMLAIARDQSLRLDGILIQEMQPVAQELIVGFRRDAVFGPLILVGRGGVEVELRPDVAMAYLPLSAPEIEELLLTLKTIDLFRGHRGGPGGDLAKLASALAKIGDRFVGDETIEEMEINPLALTRAGEFFALDVLVQLRQSSERAG